MSLLHTVLQAQEKHHVRFYFMQPTCTGELQPLDLTVETGTRRLFHQVVCWISQGPVERWIAAGNTKPDLRVSVLKPLHANWLIQATSYISRDVMIEGYVKAWN